MKKFYSLMAAAAVALLSYQASAYTVTLAFDDPSAIASVTTYSDYDRTVEQATFTPAASMAIDYDNDTKIINVVANEGFALTKCQYVFPPNIDYAYMSNAYKSDHQIYVSSGNDGGSFTYTTVNMVAARSNTANVTVTGDASKVKIQFSGTYLSPELVEGDNAVKFMDSEKTFTIGPASYSQSLYKVWLNDVEQTPSGKYWYVTVADGDNLLIEANYPDIPCAVTFTLPEGMENYVTAVNLNGSPVADWQDGFTANGGDNLYITVDTLLYKLLGFTVNGESKSLYGSYQTVVSGSNLDFVFDIVNYGVFTATVTVDHPERLLYKVNYQGTFEPLPGKTFELKMAENVASSVPFIFTTADESCYVVSFTAGDNTVYKQYDGTYSTYITDGMAIDITTGELVRDQTAYFYFHNPSAASDYNKGLYGYDYSNAFYNTLSLQQGYNRIDFDAAQENPFKFQVSGNLDYVEPYVKYYVNDELVAHTDEYNCTWQMPYANNDVIKVYITNEGVESIPVEFRVDETLASSPEYVFDYVRVVDLADAPEACNSAEEEETATYIVSGTSVLPGTHVIVRPNGNEIEVEFNDAVLTPDEDGNVAFDVASGDDKNIVYVHNAKPLGIDSVVAAGSADDTRVFNLQGIEMSGDNLPAGLYIRGGRKFIVR